MPQHVMAPARAASVPTVGQAPVARSAMHDTLRGMPDYASQMAMLAPVQMERVNAAPAAAAPAAAPAVLDSRVPSLEVATQELIDALESGDCEQQAHAEAAFRESWAQFRAEHEADVMKWQKSPPKPGSPDYAQYRALYDRWHNAGSALYLVNDEPCDESTKQARKDMLKQVYIYRKAGPKPAPKKDPKPTPKKKGDPTPIDPVTPAPEVEDGPRVHIEFNLFETPELNIPAGIFKLKGGMRGRVIIDAAADMSDATAQIIIDGDISGLFNAAYIADIGLKGTVVLEATASATWTEDGGWAIAPMEGDLDTGVSFVWDTWGKALDGERELGTIELLHFSLPGWSQQGGMQGGFDVSPGKDVQKLMDEVYDWVPGLKRLLGSDETPEQPERR